MPKNLNMLFLYLFFSFDIRTGVVRFTGELNGDCDPIPAQKYTAVISLKLLFFYARSFQGRKQDTTPNSPKEVI